MAVCCVRSEECFALAGVRLTSLGEVFSYSAWLAPASALVSSLIKAGMALGLCFYSSLCTTISLKAVSLYDWNCLEFHFLHDEWSSDWVFILLKCGHEIFWGEKRGPELPTFYIYPAEWFNLVLVLSTWKESTIIVYATYQQPPYGHDQLFVPSDAHLECATYSNRILVSWLRYTEYYCASLVKSLFQLLAISFFVANAPTSHDARFEWLTENRQMKNEEIPWWPMEKAHLLERKLCCDADIFTIQSPTIP